MKSGDRSSRAGTKTLIQSITQAITQASNKPSIILFSRWLLEFHPSSPFFGQEEKDKE